MTGPPENQTRIILTGRATREITARTNYEWADTERGTRIVDATRISMGQLRDVIQSSIGRPVIDKTGLTGLYQFRIELPRNMEQEAQWAQRLGNMTNRNGERIVPPPADNTPSSASAFKAIEGLGLRLQERRAPYDVLIVNSLLKEPRAN
jgi:uncharacterized protein (TIGR03435 family)